MNRILISAAVASVVSSGAALAHPGHIAEAAGHSHWMEYAMAFTLVSLAAVAIGAILRGQSSSGGDDDRRSP